MPKTDVAVDTVLFDMDGVRLGAHTDAPGLHACGEQHVEGVCRPVPPRHGGIGTRATLTQLRNAHGHRTIENLSRYIPGLQGRELENEVKRFESRILEIAEEKVRASESKTAVEGTIVPMPGAKELIAQINEGKDENPSRRAGWAVVTSGMYCAR